VRITCPQRNRIARRLAGSLEAARPASGPCLSVETDIDVVLWRVPKFTFRRPDVVVYKCLDDPGQEPDASQTLAVVEVSSPGTVREDLTDKRTQYAAAGIPLYLTVFPMVSITSFLPGGSTIAWTAAPTGTVSLACKPITRGRLTHAPIAPRGPTEDDAGYPPHERFGLVPWEVPATTDGVHDAVGGRGGE